MHVSITLSDDILEGDYLEIKWGDKVFKKKTDKRPLKNKEKVLVLEVNKFKRDFRYPLDKGVFNSIKYLFFNSKTKELFYSSEIEEPDFIQVRPLFYLKNIDKKEKEKNKEKFWKIVH